MGLYYNDINQYIFSGKSLKNLNEYSKKQVTKLKKEVAAGRDVKICVFRNSNERPNSKDNLDALEEIFTSNRFLKVEMLNREDAIKILIGDKIDKENFGWRIASPKEKIIKKNNPPHQA